ncbi:hypothetical protein C5167_017589 [Papaver somniferum]|uniref:Uncharacterized protein n=1 Tax=Papaver somniferum TaxID=3469 RepID=A0A4Y7IN45_PAPSO|nr:hypothetical protein C5167_017589 [Papaver somniferum]
MSGSIYREDCERNLQQKQRSKALIFNRPFSPGKESENHRIQALAILICPDCSVIDFSVDAPISRNCGPQVDHAFYCRLSYINNHNSYRQKSKPAHPGMQVEQFGHVHYANREPIELASTDFFKWSDSMKYEQINFEV